MVESEGAFVTGGKKRLAPTGGSAYGIPPKNRTVDDEFAGTPCTVNRFVFTRRSEWSSIVLVGSDLTIGVVIAKKTREHRDNVDSIFTEGNEWPVNLASLLGLYFNLCHRAL